jgi:hypothetical protein
MEKNGKRWKWKKVEMEKGEWKKVTGTKFRDSRKSGVFVDCRPWSSWDGHAVAMTPRALATAKHRPRGIEQHRQLAALDALHRIGTLRCLRGDVTLKAAFLVRAAEDGHHIAPRSGSFNERDCVRAWASATSINLV